MREIKEGVALIAKCGLYCGSCKKLLKGKCMGCLENEKASWCKIRTCCLEKNIASCADCIDINDVMACKMYNNFMAKLFGFVFNSDRSACIIRIKEKGYDQFAKQMAQNKIVSFKRKSK